ncbi:MAG: response regulator [Polaromonas sp.]|nr:response regulator [Polaromonas sp.]
MDPATTDLKHAPRELQQPKRPLSTELAPLRALMVLFIAVPLLAYLAYGADHYQQMRQESELRLDRTLRIAQEHALKVLQTNEILLEQAVAAQGIDDEAALRRRQLALHRQLSALSRGKVHTEFIWVWDANGQPLVNNRLYPVPLGLNVSDRDYFKWHQAKQAGLYVSERSVGRATGVPYFNMSRGRYRPDGSFAGVTSVGLSTSYFEAFAKDLLASEAGMSLTMLREDGAILMRWPVRPRLPSRLASDSPVMIGIGQGQAFGDGQVTSPLDQQDRLMSYTKVGDYPVYLVTSQMAGQIVQDWMREMGWLAAFGFPPMMGLLLASRMVLRRTKESLAAAEQLSNEMVSRQQVEGALLQAQKMEALGRLTGAVAHDFNNALMVISTNLALVEQRNAEDKQLRAIDRAVQAATKLTRQLLSFSHRQPLLPEYVHLPDWLCSVQDLIRPVLGRQVQLSVSATQGVHAIYVDSAELELALINLAINAKDAMPEGGQLHIAARNAETDLPPGLQGPLVVIEVSDTGHGIPADIVNKVFEPFFTTKPLGEGTGLGLSQIYGLCQRAGGVVTVQSQMGTGSTFKLFFPAFDGVPGASDRAPSRALSRLEKDLVLVEDNAEVAQALIPALEAMGCKVRHFDRATLAKDWLAQQTSLPDVLLSDVVMPGSLDGLGLARHVRTAYPQLKVVLMSGYAQQLGAITGQGFEIVPKPCSPAQLAEAIERVSAAGQREDAQARSGSS